MPISFARGNRLTTALVASIVFVVTTTLLWLYLRPPGAAIDEHLKSAFTNVERVTSYNQNSQTEIDLSDRRLHIEGVYSLNGPRLEFASIATTSILIPTQNGTVTHSFTLENISIQDDLYTKIDTSSPLLRASIPHGPWRHFKKNAVPTELKDIAVSGPILDTLLLFSSQGSYVSLITSHGDTMWNQEKMRRYTFKLSPEVRALHGGTLETLVGRIATGTVDIWIDREDTIRHAVLNGDTYHSTTTFSHFNTPPIIVAPI